MLIAKYTEVLKNLLDNEQTKELINAAMSEYPLYESKTESLYGIPNIIPTREQLNKKILDYYKYREIGFETVGRFLDELKIALNEIMPYYNQLMFSLDQDYDIKYNVDYTKTINRDKDNTSTASSNSTNSSTTNTSANDSSSTTGTSNNYNKNVESDTPQNQLTITNKQIDSVDYANKVSWNKDSNDNNATTTGTSSANTTNQGTNSNTGSGSATEDEEIIEQTKGNYGQVSVQSLIREYRGLILNIEQEIINDPRIQELFMLVY